MMFDWKTQSISTFQAVDEILAQAIRSGQEASNRCGMEGEGIIMGKKAFNIMQPINMGLKTGDLSIIEMGLYPSDIGI